MVKRWIKYLLALVLHYSGFNYWKIKTSKQHYILMFHRLEDKNDLLNISIPVSWLGRVIEWSNTLGSLVSMTDLIDFKKPEVRFCITFDDGFKNVLRIDEIPLKFPSIIYLATEFIESNKKFWAVEVERLISNSHKDNVDLTSFHLDKYDLSCIESKEIAISKLNMEMKKFHPADIDAIMTYLKFVLMDDGGECVSGNDFLCWSEILVLSALDMEVGGHTHKHVISSRVSPEEFKDEIQLCNYLIEKNTGKNVKHFAYPNGRMQDISVFSREILIMEGYKSAVTTIEGANSVGDDPYFLKRFNVSKDRIVNPWGFPSKAMFTTMLVNPIRVH